MTNTKKLATIFILTAILITGGFVISPYAYSTGYNNDDDDDCEKEHHSEKGDDYDDSSHHSDDDDDDCVPDPCDCKKPDTLKVMYNGPSILELDENGMPVVDDEGNEVELPVTIQIFKKGKDVGKPEKQLGNDINDVRNGDMVVVSSSMLGKDRLNANTVYRILQDTDQNPDTPLEEIDVAEIHTSCSKPLFVGLIAVGKNGAVTLEVISGERNGNPSIPPSDALTCEEDQKPTPMSSITVKKALTNDNDGDAGPEDFTVTFTDIGPDGIIGSPDDVEVESQTFNALDASFSVEIPAGTYTLSEATADTVDAIYTTVLIAGDTACPSMEGEPFKLKKGKHITCTIYNDDNFVESVPGGTGEPGRIFHTNTIEFMYNSINDDDGMFVAVTQVDGTSFDCTAGLTCILIEDPVMNSRLFTVQDPLINKASSLVVINIYALDIPDNQNAFAQKCVIGTLIPGSTPDTLDFTFECETHEGIFSDLGATPPESSLGKYRINYAVIDTLVIVTPP